MHTFHHMLRAKKSCGLQAAAVFPKALRKLVCRAVQDLGAEGMATAEARQRIADVTREAHAIIGECLEAVSHELTFFPLPECFALFGFDLMVSRDWRVWLLEANADPDFAQVPPPPAPAAGAAAALKRPPAAAQPRVFCSFHLLNACLRPFWRSDEPKVATNAVASGVGRGEGGRRRQGGGSRGSWRPWWRAPSSWWRTPSLPPPVTPDAQMPQRYEPLGIRSTSSSRSAGCRCTRAELVAIRGPRASL